jgi:hypothetical protein
MTQTEIPKSLDLHAGELVEVRSKEEILSTLDKNGQLDALPFMPEMFEYCGRRFRVFKRAHKTCDPVNGLGGRRMEDAVHLDDLRCDGAAHGGCQAGCLIFWKESWLKRASSNEPAIGSRPTICSEQDVLAGTRENGPLTNPQEPTYICQATRVGTATQPLPWWDMRQYVEDYTSRNVKVSEMISSFLFVIYHNVASAGLGIGSAMRWFYDVFQKIRGGVPYPLRVGKVPKGQRTPSAKLDLQPGEMVRVKSYAEILETLDENWRNRGMHFDAEMVPYCGQTYRVLKRVDQIIDEKTGKMLRLKNDAIILEGVVCQAFYAKCRKFCPRSYYQYCREIWLERLPEGTEQGQVTKQ